MLLRALPAAALGVALLAAPIPARAACGVTADAVAEAPVVFVGTLVGATDDGTLGIFQIEDVWRGADLAADLAAGSEVEVDAAPGTFALALDGPAFQYLLLVEVRGGRLRTGDNCALFAFPWDPSYAAFRPTDAPPAAGEETGVPWQVVGVIGAAAVLLIVAGIAFRRRPGDPVG